MCLKRFTESSSMNKLIPLLKYLDRSKITPEGVVEIIHTLTGRAIPPPTAADIANAFRTRGMAGLVPMLPTLAPLFMSASSTDNEPRQIPYQCKSCGSMGLIIMTPQMFEQL